MRTICRSVGFTVLLVCSMTLSRAQEPVEPPATSQESTQSAVQQAPAQPPPEQQTPANKRTTTADEQEKKPPTEAVVFARMYLVVFVLLVLGGLFWMMIIYSNRIAQTGPLGIEITNALGEVRKQSAMRALNDKWEAGEYRREVLSDKAWTSENPVPLVPDELKGDRSSDEARSSLLKDGRIGSLPGLGSRDAETDKKRIEYLAILRGLAGAIETQALRRYEAEQRTKSVLQEGRRSVLEYFDFPSVAGQGPEFVLRFTALVTIIFAVIALSILEMLAPDQSGTILAAIAGYVLGQASGRAARGGAEEPTQTAKGAQAAPP